VNWTGDKSRLSATENFETVLSSPVFHSICLSFLFSCKVAFWQLFTIKRILMNEWTNVSNAAVWTKSCLVLTQFPIHKMVTYCDVIFVNSLDQVHKYVHTEDKSPIYWGLYWKLSATVANSVHTTDETRQSCLLSVGGVNLALDEKLQNIKQSSNMSSPQQQISNKSSSR